LLLGNLDAKRDWGYAPEYVEGMWRMLQQEEPDDFVMATGESHTVREFVNLVFRKLDMKLDWKGEGVNEKGVDKNGRILVEIDKNYFRPTEVDYLIGDAGKAEKELGWKAKTKFEDLVSIMAKADWEKVQKRGF
jgi:GDPmannose 4,6-dehydratase